MSNEEQLNPVSHNPAPVNSVSISPSEEKPATADSGNLSFAVSLAALVAGLTAIALTTIFQPKIEQPPSVYVIDSQKIVETKLRSLQTNDATPESVRRDAADFMDKLQKFIKSQSDAGRTVINKNAVISWPEGADITQEAAKAMGVELAVAQPVSAATKAPAAPSNAEISVPTIPLTPAKTEALPEIPLPSSQGGQ
jgi:hypothetical protein